MPISIPPAPEESISQLPRARQAQTGGPKIEELFTGFVPGPPGRSSTSSAAATATTSIHRHSFWRRYLSTFKWLLIDQWFLVALASLILISSQLQVPASQQGKKELVVTYLCVSVIFIVNGCTVPTRILLNNYARWKIHLFVQIQCFLMTSAITFGVVSICATNPNFMDPGLLVGMIFTGCLPTTMSSNVIMTKQAHGNHALTMVQSTLGNFLGPFLTPLLITMYTSTNAWYTHVLPPTTGGYGPIYRRVFKQLGLSIFLPLFIGQTLQNLFPTQTRHLFHRWHLSKLASLSLLVIIWQAFDQAFSTRAFSSVRPSDVVFLVFISAALYLLWTAVCVLLSLLWLPRSDTVAVAYCVPAKTPAMGVPLSNVMFVGLAAVTESKVQIPMVLFQGFQVVAGSLLTLAFRRWIRVEEEGREAVEKEEGVV